jgi:hypothetical protein
MILILEIVGEDQVRKHLQIPTTSGKWLIDNTEFSLF